MATEQYCHERVEVLCEIDIVYKQGNAASRTEALHRALELHLDAFGASANDGYIAHFVSAKLATNFQPIDTAPTNKRVLIFSDEEMAMAWKDRGDEQWYYVPFGGRVTQFRPLLWCDIPNPGL